MPDRSRLAPTALLEVQTQREDDGVRVVARGEIDLSNADAVTDALVAADRTEPATVVLDLTGVTFIDSTGLRMLLQAGRRSREDGGRLHIVVSPFAERLIDVSGTRDHLPLD